MLDVNELFRRDPLSDDGVPQGFDELAREAHDLARRAYLENHHEDYDRAERMLFAMHTTSEHHAPFDARAHVVWSMLAAAKLRSLRDAAGALQPLGPTELRANIHALIAERGTGNHSLLARMAREGKDGRALRLWAKNWFASSHGFTRQLTGVALRSHRDDQPALAHALAEEFQGTRHYDLRKQFLDYLGLSTANQIALSDPEYLPECLALTSYRCVVASWKPADYAIGAYTSIEGNWAIEAGKLVEAFAAAGITGKPVEVFVVHSQLDEGHADEWLDIACAAHHTDEDRGRAFLGAKMQLAVRWRMYDAIERAAGEAQS